ncbi:neutrophil defensin 4-like [Lemur catta]|uniref:neutrophil defensin 4-like n=1 Tax=Lemur catta TaxID=9447 RepID=UPI001E26A04D|nr:neutrophil defensin 4-like [Lemur catta]XP_045391595.1 neutrophil defensin 4-like [Lemur catta]
MRTLALLAALVLVTLQAQAGPLQEREEEIPALELPGAQDPDVSISITWGENALPQAPVRSMRCPCRPFCLRGEYLREACPFPIGTFFRCCRLR